MLVLMAGILGVIAFTSSSASAALTSTPFGCRASVLRATLLNNVTVEPYIANSPLTPCSTSSDGVNSAYVPTQPSATTSTLATAGPAGAYTYNAFDSSGQTAPGAVAVASVEGVTVPTSSGNVYVAGPIQATAQYQCVNDQLQAATSSNFDLLYISGQAHHVPDNASSTIQLGGGAYVAVNEKVQTGNSLTIDLLQVHIPGVADIVVGEAKVSQSITNPCAGTTGAPAVLEICPKGSTLEAAKQLCVITIGGKTIVVSRPFQGPSGGTVEALTVAKKKYHSPCLAGNTGPQYALIATKTGGRVNGTMKSDRIIGLGSDERIAGLGGNDCIDGKGASDKIYDGNGKDKVYASRGTNRIGVGNGVDLVEGGSGNDTITAGSGNDTIYGNAGNDKINSGVGHDKDFGGPGNDRIYTPSLTVQVNCGNQSGDKAFLRNKAMQYAKKHGCKHIVHLV